MMTSFRLVTNNSIYLLSIINKGKFASLDSNFQQIHINTGFKHSLLGTGMVAQTLNPSTQEAETNGSL